MLDKNGKKVSKPKAKKMLAYALARSCIKNNDEVQNNSKGGFNNRL